MNFVFYLSAAVAVASTTMVIVQANAVHALLYLIVSLLAVALVLFTLGAPLVAAVEVIVYAGAILVLFLFVVMMLNVAHGGPRLGSGWLAPRGWVGPALLSSVLLGELLYVVSTGRGGLTVGHVVGPRAVGVALFTSYLLGVELAAMLLLSAMVGAFHLGRREQSRALTSAEPGRVAGQRILSEFSDRRESNAATAVPLRGNGQPGNGAEKQPMAPPIAGGPEHGQRSP